MIKEYEKSGRQERAITGCLWGTAVGDALGLPCEGLSKRRQQRLYPNLAGYHLLFGRGMVSDDTEHTWMTAQALCLSKGNPALFGSALARQLRGWLLAIPAGVGFATLRATLRLCLGWSWARSGVYSAGNGPAMRSALIGVCYGQDMASMKALVGVSTRVTHTDPKAEYGAIAIAVAGWIAASELSAESSLDLPLNFSSAQRPPLTASVNAETTMWHNSNGESERQQAINAHCEQILRALPAEAEEFAALLERARVSVLADKTTEDFAIGLGLYHGISGYIYHTVPVVLHAWLRYPCDYERAVLTVIRCGGDTDTTAAIVGALVGAAVGKEGISAKWRSGICEWPRTPARMEHLGRCLSRSQLSETDLVNLKETTSLQTVVTSPSSEMVSSQLSETSLSIPRLNPIALVLRNLLFLIVILLHGFRRLFPPY